ncbi:MAG: hypothetical protein PHG25_01490 [Candidatus Pacebacteria bacterium]|nr:hypothetical protein [Candidatus Paceibacterota bacterium]
MKHSHSHIPLLIFAIAVTLVVAALYGYMYQATSVSINRAGLARDIVITEQNDQTQAKKLSVIASDSAFDRAQLPNFFIPSDNVVSFITSLESLGPQSGTTVSLTGIDSDPLTNAEPGTIGHARAHIDGAGTWGSVMRLLALSEQMPYAASISHVRLSSSAPDEKKQVMWTISLDLQAAVLVTAASAVTQ